MPINHIQVLLILIMLLFQISIPKIWTQTNVDGEKLMTQKTEGIREGDLAPNFSLPDAQGNIVSLSDFRDRPVVLYFYPKDFTPGCTQEACDFRDNYQPLQELGAVVLGVSPDSAQTHQKFIVEHQLPFTLLADTEREVIKKYGFWGVKYMYGRQTEGVIRSTVLVDGEGKVRKVWKNVKVDGHIKEVIEELGRITQKK